VDLEKQDLATIAIHDDIHTGTEDEGKRKLCLRPNALESIRANLESDSNVIDESDLQLEKHDEQRNSTFRGITID
jgi:hypothetical protein